ncbi:MAG: aminotransferase class V-fold PLP-dependent enzyme [Actinophytocola sp.]|uniref:aminotransferase class V-fold PLP-dependent enzyme n=1 Tax=Actinophytocola sp. TaxID=1872138 RepID=UPI003C71DD3A
MVEPRNLDTAVIDLDAVVADTPGAHRGVFLDSAGSSLPPVRVLDEVVNHLRREAEVGGYRAAAERDDDLSAGYEVLARMLGCDADEVAFTDSATRSWLAAFDAIPLAPGDRILSTEAEYGGNAVPLLRRAAEAGATVEPIPSDSSGAVDVSALRSMLDDRVRLVSLVHVPTNGGLVNPAEAVIEAAHEAGALVMLDACQSVGQVALTGLDADIVTGSGRKWLRGPRGTGFLVVRGRIRDRLLPRQVDLHSGTWETPDRFSLRQDARVFELWESSIADRLGLIAAVRYALDLGIDNIEATVRSRAEHLRAGLAELPGVTVHDLGTHRCGLVTFTVDGVAPATVRDHLLDHHITVTLSATTSTQYDMTRRGLDVIVRASPHYFITPAQLDDAIAAVAAMT